MRCNRRFTYRTHLLNTVWVVLHVFVWTGHQNGGSLRQKWRHGSHENISWGLPCVFVMVWMKKIKLNHGFRVSRPKYKFFSIPVFNKWLLIVQISQENKAQNYWWILGGTILYSPLISLPRSVCYDLSSVNFFCIDDSLITQEVYKHFQKSFV